MMISFINDCMNTFGDSEEFILAAVNLAIWDWYTIRHIDTTEKAVTYF